MYFLKYLKKYIYILLKYLAKKCKGKGCIFRKYFNNIKSIDENVSKGCFFCYKKGCIIEYLVSLFKHDLYFYLSEGCVYVCHLC